MIAVGKVDIGRKRSTNQDGVFVSNTPIGALANLYIVADGMGGHNGGEKASKLAIESFCAYIEVHDKVKISDDEDVLLLLKRGVAHANYIIYREAENDPEYKGMGTTITLCTVRGDKAYIAHVGDTRMYVMNTSYIDQVTIDHSLVQEMLEQGVISETEMQAHPQRHVITRAVGTYENVKVDTFVRELKGVDYILLCSDGLTSMVGNKEVHETVYTHSPNIEIIADRLIQTANDHGGMDNIAVVAIKRCEVIV